MRYFILIILLLSCSCALSQDNLKCDTFDLDIIQFKKKSSRLNPKAKQTLDKWVLQLKKQPACVVVATSRIICFDNKYSALHWDRMMAVSDYLEKKGVANDRLLMTSFMEGDLDVITLTLTSATFMEDPPPHPSQRRNK